MTTILLAASVALLVASAVQASRFVLRYRRRAWRRTPAGRHLMAMTATLAVILWATLALAVIPMPTWAALLVQVVLFAALTYELTARNLLLTRYQREGAAEHTR